MAYTKPYTKQEKKEMAIVEKSVKEKKSFKRISEENPGLYKQKIDKIAKALIRDGRITKEQIQANAKAEFLRTKNKERFLTLEEQEKFVANMLEEGFLFSDILEKDKMGCFTINRLDNIKAKLIREGRIDKDLVEAKRQERLEQIRKEENDTMIEKIRQYTELGYNKTEIGNIIGYERHAITNIIKKYSKNHPWYTEEELNSFAEKRKKSVDKEIKTIKKHMKNGLSYDEIAVAMESNKTHISKVVKEYKKNNPWFSKEDFKEFKKARLEREEKEKLKQEERERKREEKEQKEKEKNESLLERYEIYRKRVVRGYDEFIRGNNSKVVMFKDYLDILMAMEEKGLEVDISDIRKASVIVADCTALATKKYLKYVILQHNRFFGEESTIAYINRIIRENEEDENKQDLIEKLQKYKNVIHELNLKRKILKMIQEEEKINDISNELGVSYQYVVELYKKDINTDIDQR